MGGRLALFAHKWEKIDPGPWVLEVVSRGYALEFTSPPPTFNLRRETPAPSDPAQLQTLRAEVESLLQKQATRRVAESEQLPLFRSSFFLAPKKGGSWRPILNLRALNKGYIRPRRFRMETIHRIAPLLERGMWATSIDLRDAYLHIPIREADQRFLAFTFEGRDYQFRALPFGLSTAPRVFTRVTRPILAFLRRQGVTLFAYLDDWLIVAPSRSRCELHTELTLSLLEELGWVLNRPKSRLTPAQAITYLGTQLDFIHGTVTPTVERVQNLRQAVARILRSPASPARLWLQALGQMSSLVGILDRCRLHMRPLQGHLLSFYSPASSEMDLPVPLLEELRPYLEWWTQPANVSSGRPFSDSRPSVVLVTDASLSGWGATLGDLMAAGQWLPPETSLHINILEMEAVIRAITHWAARLRNHVVSVRSDNTATVTYINREGGTRSKALTNRVWTLLTLCDGLNIALHASHLPGSDNQTADALSRGLGNQELSLTQAWADRLFQMYGRPSIDLFATPTNSRLPRFCSRHPHPTAWATDAFSIQWEGHYLYAFPPLGLIHRVLTALRGARATMLLIAPFWPNQPWFPLLLQLLVDLPFRLPRTRSLFTGPDQGPLNLHLSVWKLSSVASERQAFLHRSSLWRQPLSGHPQLELMMPGSPDSDSGRNRTIAIPWRRP